MILGAALGSNFNSESSLITLKVAFIEHEDSNEQMVAFLQDIQDEVPDEALQAIESSLPSMEPIQIITSVFDNEEVNEFLQVDYVDPSERDVVMNDDSYTAIIEVPNNFTYNVLHTMVFGNNDAPTLSVTYNEEEQFGSTIVNNFLSDIQEQLTKGSYLGKNGIDLSTVEIEEIKTETISLNEKNPISASAYYTIGMIVMNVLFLAGAVSYYAFYEKELKVFNRIILAGVSRWTYFSGILISGTLYAFLQSCIIFLFSKVFYGINWPNIIDFLIVTIAFSFAVGGLAVLLSAINYRLNSETITSFFMNIVVTILAVIGGSFYPIGDFVPLIQTISNMTPNGAGLTAYLSLLRGDGLAAVSDNLLFLGLFGVVMVVIAALCFPKRGVSA